MEKNKITAKKDNSERKILFGITVSLFAFTLLPIIAPIAAYLKLEVISDPIYGVYQWFCHQRPWRSYHLFDYQLAMDSRMMLMFGSMAIGSLVVYIKKLKPLKPMLAAALVIIFIIPLGLDGVIQSIAEVTSYGAGELPFYESTNLTRSITGTFFGIGIAFGLMPFLNSRSEQSKFKEYFRSMLLTLVLSLLFIILLAVGWSITSNIYLPSNFFVDTEARFPGYNYEITTSAGHSTIQRVIDLKDEKIYLDRAIYYDKEELLDEYFNNQ